MNPVFPLHEYIPDGEPHLFEGRLYLYGSHDEEDGKRYCPGSFVTYSCPVDNLNDWRYEGEIYNKKQDPLNADGSHDLYAPDVVQGRDGWYYLYYGLDLVNEISVARSASPKGPFSYYGIVRYPPGTEREKLPYYPYSFDPGLLNDGNHIWLALGFSVDFQIPGLDLKPQNQRGAFITELEDDMLTMKCIPQYVIPGYGQGKGTSFEGHEFLEASSLRKYNGHYYFIYSSQSQHELCCAVSDSVYGPYTFQNVLISNADENGLQNNWANNHGSIVQVHDSFYMFYHRHTYGRQYSRQACAEKIEYDGIRFSPAAVTTGGMEGLLKKGTLPAARACFVCDLPEGVFIPFGEVSMDTARIEGEQIVNIRDSKIVFRYFESVSEVILVTENAGEGSVSLYMGDALQGTQELGGQIRFEASGQCTDITLIFHSRKPLILKEIRIL